MKTKVKAITGTKVYRSDNNAGCWRQQSEMTTVY